MTTATAAQRTLKAQPPGERKPGRKARRSALMEELAMLEAKWGGLSPKRYVEWARTHPDSASYKSIWSWDDRRAAADWRLAQARNIIGRYRFSITIDGEQFQPRLYRNVIVSAIGAEERREYRTVNTIKGHKRLEAQVLQDALDRLLYWRDEYVAYSSLFGQSMKWVDKAIRCIKRRIGKSKGS